MNKKLIALIAMTSLLAIGLLAGCTLKGGVTLGDDGSKVDYDGKTITVTVPSNATTGYEWSYTLEGSSIKYTGEKNTTTASAGTNAVGVSSMQTYTFEGVSEGQSKITLTYARSWEKTDPARTCTITVDTDSSGNTKNLVAESKDDEGNYTLSTATLNS